MTIEEIRELIQVVNETGIAELMVQRGEHSVKIVRALVPNPGPVVPMTTVVPMATNSAGVANISPAASQSLIIAPSPAEFAEPDETANDILVKSPIVGTYYDAPSPDAPKFVKVGDRVEPKQVLCIIESMKLMNEIEAETAGVVVSKYIDNGRPVEYGESLFSIRPVKS